MFPGLSALPATAYPILISLPKQFLEFHIRFLFVLPNEDMTGLSKRFDSEKKRTFDRSLPINSSSFGHFAKVKHRMFICSMVKILDLCP